MAYEVNEDEVERRVDRLRSEYGDPPVETERWERSPEEFDRLVGYAEDGYVGGAYAWVVRHPEDAADLTESMPDEANEDRKRVLMALGRGRDEWGLPGGGLEDGEIYEAAARREVLEETGVECEPVDPFLLRRVTVVPAAVEADDEAFAVDSDQTATAERADDELPAADEEPAAEEDRTERVHLLYVFFDATYEGGSIAVQPGELDGAAWFAEPPERLMPANERRAKRWNPDGPPAE